MPWAFVEPVGTEGPPPRQPFRSGGRFFTDEAASAFRYAAFLSGKGRYVQGVRESD